MALKDDRPDWVQDLVYDAHGDFLPDDWRYACIHNALEFISNADDPEEDSGEFAGSAVDVYTSDRFAWLASHLSRRGYVDDAAEEFGTEGAYADGIVGAVGMGQYMEAREVYAVLRSLEERAEEED